MKGRKPKTIKTAPEDAITVTPRPPVWLGKHAKAEWKRVAPILVARGVLTYADLGSLEGYCTAAGVVAECQKAIDKDGLFVKDLARQVSPNGKQKEDGTPGLQLDRIVEKGVKRHPALGVMNAALTTMRQYAAELGLTPVSRSRPTMTDARDEDLSFLE